MEDKFGEYFGSGTKVECFEIDTRRMSLRRCPSFPPRLYILDSVPLDIIQLKEFISSLVSRKTEIWQGENLEITHGFWALKYVTIICTGRSTWYVLNRYAKKIFWERI